MVGVSKAKLHGSIYRLLQQFLDLRTGEYIIVHAIEHTIEDPNEHTIAYTLEDTNAMLLHCYNFLLVHCSIHSTTKLLLIILL